MAEYEIVYPEGSSVEDTTLYNKENCYLWKTMDVKNYIANYAYSNCLALNLFKYDYPKYDGRMLCPLLYDYSKERFIPNLVGRDWVVDNLNIIDEYKFKSTINDINGDFAPVFANPGTATYFLRSSYREIVGSIEPGDVYPNNKAFYTTYSQDKVVKLSKPNANTIRITSSVFANGYKDYTASNFVYNQLPKFVLVELCAGGGGGGSGFDWAWGKSGGSGGGGACGVVILELKEGYTWRIILGKGGWGGSGGEASLHNGDSGGSTYVYCNDNLYWTLTGGGGGKHGNSDSSGSGGSGGKWIYHSNPLSGIYGGVLYNVQYDNVCAWSGADGNSGGESGKNFPSCYMDSVWYDSQFSMGAGCGSKICTPKNGTRGFGGATFFSNAAGWGGNGAGALSSGGDGKAGACIINIPENSSDF